MLSRTVDCPLEGLEDVSVTFNLMATERELEAFVEKMGRSGTAGPVIVSVDNWPKKHGEAFGSDTPFAFMLWASRKGFSQAAADYLADPS